MSGYRVLPTPIGAVGLAWSDTAVTEVWLPVGSAERVRARLSVRHDHRGEAEPGRAPDFAESADEGIRRLLCGDEVDLSDIPVELGGVTDFDRAVYTVIRAIPLGSRLTYGEVAARLDVPQGAQAVGRSLGRNPVPIIVPCHRVVGASSIGGFSAPGGSLTKLRILDIESVHTEGPVQSALPF